MTINSRSLLRRVQVLESKMATAKAPRHWVFVLIGDEPLPECLSSQIKEADSMYLRRIVLDGDQMAVPSMTCTVVMANKSVYSVDLASGQWAKVTKRM